MISSNVTELLLTEVSLIMITAKYIWL